MDIFYTSILTALLLTNHAEAGRPLRDLRTNAMTKLTDVGCGEEALAACCRAEDSPPCAAGFVCMAKLCQPCGSEGEAPCTIDSSATGISTPTLGPTRRLTADTDILPGGEMTGSSPILDAFHGSDQYRIDVSKSVVIPSLDGSAGSSARSLTSSNGETTQDSTGEISNNGYMTNGTTSGRVLSTPPEEGTDSTLGQAPVTTSPVIASFAGVGSHVAALGTLSDAARSHEMGHSQ